MKDFLAKIQQFKWLLIPLSFLALFFLILGIVYGSRFADFYINLAAGAFTLLGTFFIVDVLLEKQRRREWREAHDVAKSDLVILGNMLVSHISLPFGLSPIEKIDSSKTLEEQSDKMIREILKDMKERTRMILNGAQPKHWQHLQMNLGPIRSTLSKSINLYQGVLPPDISGKLLSVRKTFESFYGSFGILPDLFTKPEENWPPNRGGQNQNREIRRGFLIAFEQVLTQLFTELEDFFNVLDNWKRATYD